MKEKENINFYYSTFRIYEKELNDELVDDYLNSDKKDKTKYLLEVLTLGLRTKQQNASLISKNETDTILNRLSSIEQTLGAIQKQLAAESVKNDIFYKLLCNIYHYTYFTMNGDRLDDKSIEAGYLDSPPKRLQAQIDKSLRALYGT